MLSGHNKDEERIKKLNDGINVILFLMILLLTFLKIWCHMCGENSGQKYFHLNFVNMCGTWAFLCISTHTYVYTEHGKI